VEHFRQLLDPATGRMDIAAEQGKRINGGFSIGAPGVASGLFVENYGRGLIGDSRVIIHEGGHAIHKQLMSEGGVSPFYTQGPNWMFDGFAILNEFLFYDRLYRSSTRCRCPMPACAPATRRLLRFVGGTLAAAGRQVVVSPS
jgi:oligoendopeptidase F